MSAAERQAMGPGQDRPAPQTAVMPDPKTAMAPPGPGTLDPLIRALDRAVVRSAQAGPGSGDRTPGDRGGRQRTDEFRQA